MDRNENVEKHSIAHERISTNRILWSPSPPDSLALWKNHYLIRTYCARGRTRAWSNNSMRNTSRMRTWEKLKAGICGSVCCLKEIITSNTEPKRQLSIKNSEIEKRSEYLGLFGNQKPFYDLTSFGPVRCKWYSLSSIIHFAHSSVSQMTNVKQRATPWRTSKHHSLSICVVLPRFTEDYSSIHNILRHLLTFALVNDDKRNLVSSSFNMSTEHPHTV